MGLKITNKGMPQNINTLHEIWLLFILNQELSIKALGPIQRHLIFLWSPHGTVKTSQPCKWKFILWQG